MVVTLNSRARFERYPNSPGFSDEPGLFFASSPTVALFRDFAGLVVAPQGKTTVSFRSPVSLARGFFCVLAAFGCVAPPPIQSPQRCNVLFRQT